MGFERVFGIAADDQFGELRREKTFQPAETFELVDLLFNALRQFFVPLGKLGGLMLNLVLELLDPQ
jgi:hypothetical protein